MNILVFAKHYLEKGFSIIPVGKDKIPRLTSWTEYQTRRPTGGEVSQWFNNGQANIGIVTGKISGIVVVDFDNEEAIKFAKANNFPTTPMVKTSRGYHAYYRYRDGVRNFQKRDDLPGIDLRGDGGFAVAPPSIHETGTRYEWIKGRGLDDLPLADLPEIILINAPQDKTPLAELYRGVDQGSRNDTLARLVGSWANDGLSFEECLENAYLWNEKNNPPLPLQEVRDTVESILKTHHRKQKIVSQVMSLIRLGDLLKEPEEIVSWQVEGILPVGGFSILASKPKVGKSTLSRNLALHTAQGKSFMGREVNKGPVIYYALEEKKHEVRRHFEDMGATGEENIYIYTGSVPVDALTHLREVAQSINPTLIIIDPLFRLTRIKDGNDYAQVTQALEPLLRLARETGTHVLCTHHTTKGDRQGGDSVLGSTAIFSTVDTLLLMRRLENYRTIQTIQRYGEDLEETTLHFDKDTRTLSIGKSKQEEDIDTVKKVIIEFLSSQEEPVREAVITEEIEGRTTLKRKALRDLVGEGTVVRDGKGGKGDPFKYSCSLVPVYMWEQQNKNPKNAITSCNSNGYSGSQDFAEIEQSEKTREQAFSEEKEEVIDLTGIDFEVIE